MKVLVKKMSTLGVLKLEMIVGAIVMAAALILLPVGIVMQNASLILNPYVLGVVIIGMLMFSAFAYFLFMRPYFAYRKAPEVLLESDGEHVYIHGKREAKIPLAAFEGAVVTVSLPFLYSNELIAVLLVHLFSEKYGDLILDVPEYGSYRMAFVSNVQRTADDLTRFLYNARFVTDTVD